MTSPQNTETAWQELALEIAGIGIWEWDFAAGRGQWSPGLCALLGLAPDQVVVGPDGLLHFVHPEDQTRYKNSIESSLEGLSDHNLEYRILLPDQHARWFLDRARVLRDEMGEPHRMIGAITDITDRKHEEVARRELERVARASLGAERALLETEHRFKEILDYAPVAVYIKNLEGRLTFVNQRFLDLFRTDREDVILQDRSSAQPPDLAKQLREHDRLVIEAGKALQFEEVIEVQGVRQTYLSVKFPLHNEDGNAYALCGISADISDRKQAEKEVAMRSAALQDAIEEINQLTYSVSHEMGSPLRGVIGNIRFLREDLAENLDPQADHRLQRVERAALKMAQLVDDLLAYSRLGRHELQCEMIDFTDLAEQILSDKMRNDESWRNCIVEVDDGISFMGDPEFVAIALKALLDNAYKFRKPDSIARIKIRCIDGGFSIADEGIGFDMQYAEKILRPFERLHRDSDYAGTGIGLAKAHRIAERHGGRVWAESQLGKGSTFFVQFSSEVPASAR